MKNKLVSGLIVGSLIATAGTIGAADQVQNGDKHFVREFSSISQEIQSIGTLAQTQSQDARVKELGRQLVQDYASAGRQVVATAAPSAPGSPQISLNSVSEVNRLAGLSGPQFDQAALHRLFVCQEYGVRAMTHENTNSSNASFRTLTQTLREGLEPDLWRTTSMSADFNGHQ